MHIMNTVSPACRSELEELMSLPPEKQRESDLSAPCKEEVNGVVAELQQGQQQQQAGGAGGAPGEGGAAGGRAPPAEPVDPRSVWPIVSAVLLALLLSVGGLVTYVRSREHAKSAFLEVRAHGATRVGRGWGWGGGEGGTTGPSRLP